MSNTTMYTHQMQKSVQEMKNLQKILEVSYETLFELEDCVKGADQQLQRWAQTLTSITAVVDQVKKAPHLLILCQRIKMEMMSFSYYMVLEFIYKKEAEVWQQESEFFQRYSLYWEAYDQETRLHMLSFSGLHILPKKSNLKSSCSLVAINNCSIRHLVI